MSKGNMVDNLSGTSKLAQLRQNKGIKKQEVDIERAIDGFAASIDGQAMMAEIARNSAIVNLIIDISGSTDGTAAPIAEEINSFAKRQAAKIYTTMLSLTLFDHKVYPKFSKLNVRQFVPILPWECVGGTNINDAIISAITPILPTDANHRLHLIVTDGENGASEHTEKQVRSLIASRPSEHIFLLYYDENYTEGSAQEYATKLGIKPENSVNFDPNGDGIKIIFQTIERLLDGLRTDGVIPKDWAKAIESHRMDPMRIKANETKYIGPSS